MGYTGFYFLTWEYMQWIMCSRKHLFGNLFDLYFFGKVIQEESGDFALWVWYILTGFMGNVMSWFILPENTISVGASGAVYGLFAISLFVKMHFVWTDMVVLLILAYDFQSRVRIELQYSVELLEINQRYRRPTGHIAHVSGAVTGVSLGCLRAMVPMLVLNLAIKKLDFPVICLVSHLLLSFEQRFSFLIVDYFSLLFLLANNEYDFIAISGIRTRTANLIPFAHQELEFPYAGSTIEVTNAKSSRVSILLFSDFLFLESSNELCGVNGRSNEVLLVSGGLIFQHLNNMLHATLVNKIEDQLDIANFPIPDSHTLDLLLVAENACGDAKMQALDDIGDDSILIVEEEVLMGRK
ncbi:hypothetical protein C5167_050980 [Papaver somniferum]|uniref:Peptidase S54 rhomboid domain-containing protein n=1 Tax=Papaver somniferum TaxID=3469 RepID=A0A4Y7KQ82_PAPSO|nr:hypothetical protein C5167_050980 [Papaver somniferum]